MPVFETLLFDLDGTLVDSLGDLGSAVNQLRQTLGLAPLTRAEIAGFVGDGARRLVERAIPQELFEGRQVEIFLEHYRRHLVVETKIYPGILACLDACADRAMAVVTNKPIDLALEILDRLSLRRYFPVVVGGDSCVAKKPDPLPLRHALLGLDRRPETALMIGDHCNDLQAGRAAGTQTCFCRWGFGSPRDAPRDFEVTSPLQLRHLLLDSP